MKEVLSFERRHTAPVKTGTDLLRVVMQVLADIQHGLSARDVTSRPLLERAISEDEVQNWVVEQMNFRSRERFHAHREAQVAGGDMPDIIVSSTSAPCQVAIEVKHGGKSWSFAALKNALREQLAEHYLKVAERRHGVLLVSHHKRRAWVDKSTGKRLKFEHLIHQLDAVADTVVENLNREPIRVRCFGIDATSPADIPPSTRKVDEAETNKRPIEAGSRSVLSCELWPEDFANSAVGSSRRTPSDISPPLIAPDAQSA